MTLINELRLTLETIARELREFADHAHGNPRMVRITAATLREYADIIDEVLRVESEQT
ncbi:MAG TPA: hypothetical protein VGF90_05490 [Verrucomicrobiae bacterium]|jgi:hypothetical protein